MSKWGRYWARKRLHENAIDGKTKEVLMEIYDFVMDDITNDNKEMENGK